MANSQERSFMQRHGSKIAGAVIWAALLIGYLLYTQAHDLTFKQALLDLANLLTTPIGPVVFVVIYIFRPLLFFPAVAISLAGGAIFGPVMGVLWTIVGSNLGALLAYCIGRFLGDGLIDQNGTDGFVQKYATRMRDNGFQTVLFMRLVYVHYDLVNYLSGILKIDWKAFIIATIIGSLPGTIMITAAGASFGSLEQALSGQPPKLNGGLIALSIAMLVISLGLSRFLKKQDGQDNDHVR